MRAHEVPGALADHEVVVVEIQDVPVEVVEGPAIEYAARHVAQPHGVPGHTATDINRTVTAP